MAAARHQKSARAERSGDRPGEAGRKPDSDEANAPRYETGNTGSTLLEAALTRENLLQAYKRVRANKGAAGVDGLDIDQTARQLMTTWPTLREQLLQGTYRPSPVRRVTIPKPGTYREPTGSSLPPCIQGVFARNRTCPQLLVSMSAALAIRHERAGDRSQSGWSAGHAARVSTFRASGLKRAKNA